MKALFCKLQRVLIFVHYLSIIKLVNLLKLILSYLSSSISFHNFLNIYPFFISVEVTNFCNLHCPECPVGIGGISKHEQSSFDFQLFRELIDELKPKLQHVILYFQGEPFLNNQFIKFIQYAHDAGIYTSTSTNGQFLNKKIAQEIVLSGLDKIIVSIDGSTQQVYETYRIGGSLQKALNGIKLLVELKRTLKSITPLIEIQFLVLKTNEHQMSEMKQLTKFLKADRLSFKSAQLYDFENGNKLLTTKNRYARYKRMKDGKFVIKGRQSNSCWRLWSGGVINVHGEVLPCCFDKSSQHSFGNIRKNSFLNCWHSAKASEFRGSILKNRKQFEMCRNCTN